MIRAYQLAANLLLNWSQWIACASGLWVVLPESLAGERPPNVVLILADDLGWSDLGCYGSDLHQTPRLDELATQAVRFAQAYSASPVCTPTRASILTGRHPARLHMTIWREASQDRGTRQLLEPVTLADLPHSEITLAQRLSSMGYRTAHVGKWHLGGELAYPETHGFQWNIGGTGWGAPASYFYPFRGDQHFKNFRYVPGLEPGKEGQYLTDRLTDKAIEVIDQCNTQPFYLNLWYHAVHTPMEGKPDLAAKYEALIQPHHRHRHAHYAAMVETLDSNVGRVIDHLRLRNLWEHTILIFLSDNGGFINGDRLRGGIPITDNSPLRSGKGSCYEGGIRVPMMIYWPTVSQPGLVSQVPVTTCDLFPTLLTGITVDRNTKGTEDRPSNSGVDFERAGGQKLVLDGQDIRSTLDGSMADSLRRSLYFHFPHYYPTTTPVSAVRQDDWKLLYFYENQTCELYNLRTDPAESTNVADKYPQRTEELRNDLVAWRVRLNAQLPEPNPN
ncbi:MAG: sulfatase [Pirellulaceae bacterium]|nr:sulfatase [Pirellulaceae bacterium]